MASLFDEIVLRRTKVGNRIEMRPLWKLKLSDQEFDELRSFLMTGVKLKYPDWFKQYPRECLLFFAEYWKRYFDGGAHSRRDVLNCLEPNLDDDYKNAFYDAACTGAGQLRIEIFKGNRKTQILDSILYQGGLPMRLICQPDREGYQNWAAFATRLIRGFIDLSDEQLGLGQAATDLKSIRQFAKQLYIGIAANDPDAMPFYCPDENHPWYKTLMALKESEQRKGQESNPFAIEWQIELDEHRCRGRILGRIRIHSKLSQSFLETHGVPKSDYTTARITTDGMVRASIEYQQGYSRMSRDILIPMPTSDTVLSVDFEGKMVATGSFDYSRPHLFSLNGRHSNGLLRGEKANRIKESEMLVFIPGGWTLDSTDQLEADDYTFSDIPGSIVRVPAGFSNDIRIKDSEGNTVVFNGNPISETQLIYTPLCSETVLSPTLCDASRLQRCHLLTETPDGVIRQSRPIEFEGTRRGQWSSTPTFGKIRARGAGEASEPVILCNVGNPDSFQIDVTRANSSEASIRISWAHGQVTCIENGAKLSTRDNAWTVRKENLLDPAAVRFRLTVTGESSSSFLLKVRAPFKQMQITDEFGEIINGWAYVPLCDYEKFSYSIFGVDSARINVESERYRLNGLNKKLRLSAGDDFTNIAPRKIYRHGSIAALFGSTGKMRQLLQNKPGDIKTSNVTATLRTSEGGGNTIKLNIKECPFELKWNQETNVFTLKEPDIKKDDTWIKGKERPFRHSLLVFRLKNPSLPPVEISSDEDGVIRMPGELVFEKDLLIAGKVPGRVLPILCNKSDKVHTRSEIIAIIESQILAASLGSEIWMDCLDWFHQAADYGVPFSSLLQLNAIALHKETLTAFLFQCMLKYGPEGKGELLDRLIQFSRELCFKWFWLIPVVRKGIFRILYSQLDINNERFIRMMVPQAIATLPIESLQPIAFAMIEQKMVELEDFLCELIRKSFKDTHHPVNKDMYEVACGWIKDDGQYADGRLESNYELFPDFSLYLGPGPDEFDLYLDGNRSPSENWLLSRVNAFAAHVAKEGPDCFSMGEKARSSLCLCYEVAPYYFIREAHNRMLLLKNSKNNIIKR